MSKTTYFVLTRFRGLHQLSFRLEEFIDNQPTDDSPRRLHPDQNVLTDIEQRWQMTKAERAEVEDLLKDLGPPSICIEATRK